MQKIHYVRCPTCNKVLQGKIQKINFNLLRYKHLISDGHSPYNALVEMGIPFTEELKHQFESLMKNGASLEEAMSELDLLNQTSYTNSFIDLLEKGVSPQNALDQLGYSRYCCRMRLRHPAVMPMPKDKTNAKAMLAVQPVRNNIKAVPNKNIATKIKTSALLSMTNPTNQILPEKLRSQTRLTLIDEKSEKDEKDEKLSIEDIPLFGIENITMGLEDEENEDDFDVPLLDTNVINPSNSSGGINENKMATLEIINGRPVFTTWANPKVKANAKSKYNKILSTIGYTSLLDQPLGYQFNNLSFYEQTITPEVTTDSSGKTITTHKVVRTYLAR